MITEKALQCISLIFESVVTFAESVKIPGTNISFFALAVGTLVIMALSATLKNILGIKGNKEK